MQFSTLFLATAALAGLTNAVQFTNLVFNNVTAGKPFTFTWSNATGPVTISLANGPALKLVPVQVITSGQEGTSFTWPVPASLPADTYAFVINDSLGKPNYSILFQLIDGATPTTSSGTASATGSIVTMTQSVTTTASSNLTTSTHSVTRSPTGTTATGTASTTPTSAPGMAAGFTSNIAFVFLAAGALVFLH